MFENEFVRIDDTQFPKVVVTFRPVRATDATFRQYLDGLRGLYDREESFSLIFDATQAAYLPWRYQRQQALWTKEYQPLIEEYLLGTAYVVPSVLLRVVLMAIMAVQKEAAPVEVTNSMEKAYRWVKINALRQASVG